MKRVVGLLLVVSGVGTIVLMGVMLMSVFSHVKIQDTESAQKFLLGTWTYTDPIDSNNQYIGGWIKWSIHANGTLEAFYASPREDSWGKPEYKNYEIFSDKYSDTGERYFAIRPKGGAEMAIIQSDGTLGYSIMGKGAVVMKRKDVFPFSH